MKTTFPITISGWKTAQLAGGGLPRLLSFLESQRQEQSNAWISLATDDQVEAQWAEIEKIRDSDDHDSPPLWGVPFAVKDNIDASGFLTTAGCPSYTTDIATDDSPVVSRLKASGAILMGKTNLDQFATGLVGTRSPYGAVANSFDPSRVSGGSSSGSAVLVSRGIVPFSLGTDTAGSGRVPAGLNNIVGLKPTRGALSARGIVPACRTLDCVCIFTLTTEDAETVLRIAEGYDKLDAYSRERPETAKFDIITDGVCEGVEKDEGREAVEDKASSSDIEKPRMAVCADPIWFDKSDNLQPYKNALDRARNIGWTLEPVDFSPLFNLAKLLYEGPLVAERYAAVQAFIESSPEEAMDPTVRGILLEARDFSAADTFTSEYLLQDLARKIELAFKPYHAVLVPTTPTFPTIKEIEQDPVGENSKLGTYTNFVNFLDWSAISIPAGFRSDGLPFGVTLIARAWDEPKLLSLASDWSVEGSNQLLGATSRPAQELHDDYTPTMRDYANAIPIHPLPRIPIAVVGAHLTGFPLNKDLTSRDATLQDITRTSDRYQLYSLDPTAAIMKPGLKRVQRFETGHSIELEVWGLPENELAGFMRAISHPLGIGRIELQDGRWVHGFICEPIGLAIAEDISHFGGWRGYIHSLQDDSISIDEGTLCGNATADQVDKQSSLLKELAVDSTEQPPAADAADLDSYQLPKDPYLNEGHAILGLEKSMVPKTTTPGHEFLLQKTTLAHTAMEVLEIEMTCASN
jgi:urea carboxylase / allophanate hydrolase